MGLKLSQIFRISLIFGIFHVSRSQEDVQRHNRVKIERLPYPHENYLLGVYENPPLANATCSCNTENFEFPLCGPSYGDGCGIKLFGRPPCAANAKCVPGCFCDNLRGYYRHPMTLQCVKAHECPRNFNYFNCAGEHEEYRLGDDSCKDSCDFHTGSRKCDVDQCVAGCFCKKGYARSKTQGNQCVPVFDCPNVDLNELNKCPSGTKLNGET
ncbi:uncharacterized protein LOC134835139 [Culicoides brevitarsis]|uniref:uncharacterized protein LOC134835139 n=1 Tax=Culicoides brevitarsis TaxID=469753 RepID=UPI00307BA76C